MSLASSTYRFAQGLEKTFQLLGKTKNESAVDVLVPALDSPHQVIQDHALRSLLERRSHEGYRAVLAHLHTAGPNWRDIIESSRGRSKTYVLREAVLGTDAMMCVNACKATVWLRDYDLVPTLLSVLEDDMNPRAKLAAETLQALADRLLEDLSAPPSENGDRRDPQLIRHRFANSLEASVRRFGQHECVEVLSAFLLLTHRENVTLKQVLQNPQHGTFLIMIDAFLHNPRTNLIQLLLSFLDDPHAPSAAISVISRRSDPKFIQALLRKTVHPLSPVMVQNLKRIESFSWLRDDFNALDSLDEMGQRASVPLLIASGMPRANVFGIVEYLFRHGKPAGRIAATEALAHFGGTAADTLVTLALADPDPNVQAAILPQIRQRNTPGALPHLIEMLDSPQECVRQTARDNLSEFSFERYAAAFDHIEEEARRTTGVLVRKINPQAVTLLANELKILSRPRQLRALAIAQAMELIPQLEPNIIELLHDEDYFLRGEAARTLAHCPTNATRFALLEARSDRSVMVREAVEQSLRVLESSGPLRPSVKRGPNA